MGKVGASFAHQPETGQRVLERDRETAVGEKHIVSARREHAAPDRRAFPPVRAASDNRAVDGGGDFRPSGTLCRPVGAPVVGNEDFPRDAMRGEEGRRGLHVAGDFALLVKCGDDDAECYHARVYGV